MKTQVLATAVTLFGSMVAGQNVKVGCFRTPTGLTLNNNWLYQSVGYCSKKCPMNKTFALIYKDCYCGDEIPPDVEKLKDADCDTTCPGYKADTCGSKFTNATSVYLSDGVVAGTVPKADVSKIPKSSSTTSSSATSTPSVSVTTSPEGQTVTVTPSSSAAPTPSNKPNTAGIAAGVVVGVLALLAIGGGAFLIMRKRERRAIEEEHQRSAAVKEFVSGKPPLSASSSSFTDTRLDPVMAQRRMSDGSIADNQDYSRRILKVTNA